MIAVDSLQEKQLWAWQLATRIYVQDPTGLRDQRHLLHTRGIYCLIILNMAEQKHTHIYIYIFVFVVPSDDCTENNIASVGGIVKYFWQTHKRIFKKAQENSRRPSVLPLVLSPAFPTSSQRPRLIGLKTDSGATTVLLAVWNLHFLELTIA